MSADPYADPPERSVPEPGMSNAPPAYDELQRGDIPPGRNDPFALPPSEYTRGPAPPFMGGPTGPGFDAPPFGFRGPPPGFFGPPPGWGPPPGMFGPPGFGGPMGPGPFFGAPPPAFGPGPMRHSGQPPEEPIPPPEEAEATAPPARAPEFPISNGREHQTKIKTRSKSRSRSSKRRKKDRKRSKSHDRKRKRSRSVRDSREKKKRKRSRSRSKKTKKKKKKRKSESDRKDQKKSGKHTKTEPPKALPSDVYRTFAPPMNFNAMGTFLEKGLPPVRIQNGELTHDKAVGQKCAECSNEDWNGTFSKEDKKFYCTICWLNFDATTKKKPSKLGGKFAAMYMKKFGWKEGTGLGKNSQGRDIPVATKIRPRQLGLGCDFTPRIQPTFQDRGKGIKNYKCEKCDQVDFVGREEDGKFMCRRCWRLKHNIMTAKQRMKIGGKSLKQAALEGFGEKKKKSALASSIEKTLRNIDRKKNGMKWCKGCKKRKFSDDGRIDTTALTWFCSACWKTYDTKSQEAQKLVQGFIVGEAVLAKWKSKKPYEGVIEAILSNYTLRIYWPQWGNSSDNIPPQDVSHGVLYKTNKLVLTPAFMTVKGGKCGIQVRTEKRGVVVKSLQSVQKHLNVNDVIVAINNTNLKGKDATTQGAVWKKETAGKNGDIPVTIERKSSTTPSLKNELPKPSVQKIHAAIPEVRLLKDEKPTAIFQEVMDEIYEKLRNPPNDFIDLKGVETWLSSCAPDRSSAEVKTRAKQLCQPGTIGGFGTENISKKRWDEFYLEAAERSESSVLKDLTAFGYTSQYFKLALDKAKATANARPPTQDVAAADPPEEISTAPSKPRPKPTVLTVQDVRRLRVKEVRRELEARQLPTQGSKSTLVQRLKDAVESEQN